MVYISMTFKYKYVRRLKTSEKKSRKIHRYFSLDLNASLKGGVKKNAVERNDPSIRMTIKTFQWCSKPAIVGSAGQIAIWQIGTPGGSP